MKRVLFLLLISLCIITTASTQNYEKLPWVSKVGAKSFPSGTKSFVVNAVSDTTKTVTKNIQAAIDEYKILCLTQTF